MFELYWLLLLSAGIAGWCLAYIFYRGKSKPKIPGGYLKGLNYLLNEQPDKALEAFIDLVEVDTETVETHLVLGSMFRRRGEVDRAIRIHQNLVAKPALEPVYKSTALLELVKDYLKAGLLDRAEALSEDVVKVGLQVDEAYSLLLSVYEQEKEWQKAITTIKKLARARGGEDIHQVIAHYYCELGELELEKGSGLATAKKLVGKALSHDKNCVRANILLGNYAMREENYRSAIKCYQEVSNQNPAYLPEVIVKLREAFLLQDNYEGFKEFLIQVKDVQPSGILFSTLLADPAGKDVEKKMILDWLVDKSELSLLEAGVFLKNGHNKLLDDAGLAKVQKSIESFIHECASYQCEQCGFQGRTLYWQCPSCHYWGTAAPVAPGSS